MRSLHLVDGSCTRQAWGRDQFESNLAGVRRHRGGRRRDAPVVGAGWGTRRADPGGLRRPGQRRECRRRSGRRARHRADLRSGQRGGGGSSGRPLVLDVYDDQNDREARAGERSRSLRTSASTVAVDGPQLQHLLDRSGRDLRSARGLPAITRPPQRTSTVTRDNPWYFRTDLQRPRRRAGSSRSTSARCSSAERVGVIHESDGLRRLPGRCARSGSAPARGLEVAGSWSLRRRSRARS